MGGNNSKSGGDTLPARFRPLLRQRIEEFRNRRNARREECTMSTKELLKDNERSSNARSSNARSSNARSSNANENLEETQLHKEKTTACVVPVEKLSQVAPLSVYEYGNEKEEDDEEKIYKDIEKTIAAIKSALLLEENKHDEEGEEEEDEDEDEDDIGRLIGPRSPSFRIYCIEAEERKEQEKYFDTDTHAISEYLDEKENQDIDVDRKSQSTDSDESATSESENADEVVKSETNPKNKGHHKRNKLETMKKNLLNVKNIQKNRMTRIMACTGNNDRIETA